MSHAAMSAGRTAVVTGAAMGIGLAASKRFASLGMKVCMVDVDEASLQAAGDAVAALAAGGPNDVLAVTLDVANADDVAALHDTVAERLGGVGVLMNNAVTRAGGGIWEDPAGWQRTVAVNLWGIINGVRAFVPQMVAAGVEGAVVNVGSKQGITNPPGNNAYNMTKAAVTSFTESLQHTLRNTDGCRVSAHLLIPGWTTTGNREHQPGAWLPDQVVDRLIAGIEAGDFYILCQDNEVTLEMDRQRIIWAAMDITENRPPLSRWHADFKDEFDAWAAEN